MLTLLKSSKGVDHQHSFQNHLLEDAVQISTEHFKLSQIMEDHLQKEIPHELRRNSAQMVSHLAQMLHDQSAARMRGHLLETKSRLFQILLICEHSVDHCSALQNQKVFTTIEKTQRLLQKVLHC